MCTIGLVHQVLFFSFGLMPFHLSHTEKELRFRRKQHEPNFACIEMELCSHFIRMILLTNISIAINRPFLDLHSVPISQPPNSCCHPGTLQNWQPCWRKRGSSSVPLGAMTTGAACLPFRTSIFTTSASGAPIDVGSCGTRWVGGS